MIKLNRLPWDFALFLLLFQVPPAMAANCLKAPFGDSWTHYLQFSLDGAIASKGNLKLARMIDIIGTDELSKACFAKLQGLHEDSFLNMGLTQTDLKKYSVAQLAAYAQAWLAEKALLAGKHTSYPFPLRLKT